MSLITSSSKYIIGDIGRKLFKLRILMKIFLNRLNELLDNKYNIVLQ